MRVLVVEDDAKLARVLGQGLGAEGYDVELATTGPSGMEAAAAGAFDVVVLDLMLPGIDGLSVCERMRALGNWTPVLVLTARTQVEDRIRGLDSGADDYLTKPFDFGELLARLRVLTRRGPASPPAVLTVGELRLNPSTRVVTRDGRQVELTEREFRVLEVLAGSPGRPVRREELLATVWAGERSVSDNVVDVYIGYLRRKLEGPRQSRLIRTVRGRGFMLELS